MCSRPPLPFSFLFFWGGSTTVVPPRVEVLTSSSGFPPEAAAHGYDLRFVVGHVHGTWATCMARGRRLPEHSTGPHVRGPPSSARHCRFIPTVSPSLGIGLIAWFTRRGSARLGLSARSQLDPASSTVLGATGTLFFYACRCRTFSTAAGSGLQSIREFIF